MDTYPRKMEVAGSRRSMRSRKRFNIANLVGDPFALATCSIAIMAWLIAFVASILDAIERTYPNFAWWSLVYCFFCIVGVVVSIASGSVWTYHVAIVGFLATALTFTTSAANQLIYSEYGASEAAAAGFILLSIVFIVWIFYFGSQPQAKHREFVDSFALNRDHHSRVSARSSRQMSGRYVDRQPSYNVADRIAAPATYNSNNLAGLETSTAQPDSRDSARFGGTMTNSQVYGGEAAQYATGGEEGELVAPTEYPYRAKAIYSYEANPDDSNEISFGKHELLEISDVSGRWWQARKESGQTGIAPSNYLVLL